ncbi:ScbR family autoregulator-binding transcription factor [Actinomadura rupiterrae]|uniref:ScbR family autoregulator-binding transcription factor n=1 Tax=Actinomadura rupiterrae TaxID=559627 RepID=UPI0020A5E2A9|nr:ScbR family autoregulator-binding transcription factor [Actinomadura rupiterrae]MCP2336077.1 AcrR family transcriptional regulator [Actinomadura rupiterrae]
MQERARRTRQAVVRAAAAAFEVNGYGATTLQDIVAREDVSRGALYFHFPTKEALAVAIVREYGAMWDELVATLRPGQPRAVRLLIEFSFAVGRAFGGNVIARAGTRLLLETRLYESELPPPYAGWIGTVEEVLADARRQGDLASGADTAELAKFLVAAFTGLQQIVMTGGGPEDTDSCIATMWRCVLPGLVAPERLPDFTDLVGLPEPGARGR